jgi:cell filamentation protein
MTVDPYVDPATGVLSNKLGITDAGLLQQAVADISAARIDELAARRLPGSYDLDHLRAFHTVLFGDVFAWAGEIRTISIFKETGFCPPQHIVPYAAGEFARLAKENFLRGLHISDFTPRLTHYYAEMIEIHPFREGNGRTQRAFLRQLAEDAGFRLDWSHVDAEENTRAAIAAHKGDLDGLGQLIQAITTPVGNQ